LHANFRILAFTHKSTDLKWIGTLGIDKELLQERLSAVKESCQMSEIMLLSTCNRFELIFVSERTLDKDYAKEILACLYLNWNASDVDAAFPRSILYNSHEAVYHLFEVASSLDSLVVGEREIITQVRTAYEFCQTAELTGDSIRLLVKHTIETAKEVYTRTHIASRPVSVVSLAYRKLKDLKVNLDARFLVIGAGQTNTLMAEFLNKHGFKNFSVFNRSAENGNKLAQKLKGKAFLFSDLDKHSGGFDVIITCTAATEHIITPELYEGLLDGESSRKIVIDLSVPSDLDPVVAERFDLHHVDVASLQAIANENLQARKKELEACRKIIGEQMVRFTDVMRERKLELAMRDLPEQVRIIKETALNTVFASELSTLDENSRELLEKVLSYIEKKYISVPMVMAKEILLDKPLKKPIGKPVLKN
jgi:glutamyl-tRNA reductase